MSLTTYKYEVPLADEFALNLPLGAVIVSFQVQHDKPCIWALVDPKAQKAPRQFRLAGTGHTLDYGKDALRPVGTIQLHGGSLVFHLFEVLS